MVQKLWRWEDAYWWIFPSGGVRTREVCYQQGYSILFLDAPASHDLMIVPDGLTDGRTDRNSRSPKPSRSTQQQQQQQQQQQRLGIRD